MPEPYLIEICIYEKVGSRKCMEYHIEDINGNEIGISEIPAGYKKIAEFTQRYTGKFVLYKNENIGEYGEEDDITKVFLARIMKELEEHID